VEKYIENHVFITKRRYTGTAKMVIWKARILEYEKPDKGKSS